MDSFPWKFRTAPVFSAEGNDRRRKIQKAGSSRMIPRRPSLLLARGIVVRYMSRLTAFSLRLCLWGAVRIWRHCNVQTPFMSRLMFHAFDSERIHAFRCTCIQTYTLVFVGV